MTVAWGNDIGRSEIHNTSLAESLVNQGLPLKSVSGVSLGT